MILGEIFMMRGATENPVAGHMWLASH